MKYSVDKHDKYLVFKLDELKLNSLIAPKLKSELIMLNTEGFRNIILDLSEVQYSDSSGLGSLLVGHRICKNSDGIFVATYLHENINRLIHISQLEEVLNIVPTNEEAVDLIFMEEIEKELKRETR